LPSAEGLRFDHADRDEILRRAEADFPALAIDHGARRRGKVYCCPFHMDKTPSASIHNGRFHCFVCQLSLGPIAFVERAQRTTFKDALAFLGDRYGVPLNNKRLNAAEKRNYARAAEHAEQLAQDVADWASGLLGELKQQHEELMAGMVAFWEIGDEADASALEPETDRVRRKINAFEEMTPAQLVAAYVRSKSRNPLATERYLLMGQKDRENVELVTAGIVQLIAARAAQECAAC
jgi:hypothetical protein